MNPTDVLILLVSWGLAGAFLATRGFTANGLGPAVLLLLGGTWHTVCQLIRHLSWRRHRDSGSAPGTQLLALVGVVGSVICAGLALAWALLTDPHW